MEIELHLEIIVLQVKPCMAEFVTLTSGHNKVESKRMYAQSVMDHTVVFQQVVLIFTN